jgi:hypothetical protein
MHNFEAYSVITIGAAENLDLSSLDEFLIRNGENIQQIDDEALERAARNLVQPIPGASRRRATPPAPPAPGAVVVPRVRPATGLDRILIAQVPGAGGRWSQVHFNADIIKQYFRITDREIQRVYLTLIHPDGTRGEDEVRPCVYSQSNKNFKIEIAAAKGYEYPTSGRPMLVFRERQVRTFDYMLLMPGQAGHSEISRLCETLPSVGRGLRRAITDQATLSAAWPACPLLITENKVESQI